MTFTLIYPVGPTGVVPNSWVGEGSRIRVQTSLAPSIGDFIVARLQPTTFTDIIATATSNVAGGSRLCDLEVAWDDHAGRPSGIPLPGPSAANGLPAGVLVVDLVLTYFNASLAVLDGPTTITGAYFLDSLTQASGQVLRRLFDRMDAIEANLSLLVAGQAQFTSLALHTAHTGVTGAGTITPAAGRNAFKVAITSRGNNVGEQAGSPVRLFSAGWVSELHAAGTIKDTRLDRDNTLVVMSSLGSSLGYSLADGVVATITEATAS